MERARKDEGWCHQDPAQALGMDGGEETPTTSVCVWEGQNLSVSPSPAQPSFYRPLPEEPRKLLY